MAAQQGGDLLLKIDIGGTYTTIGGMRSNGISINDEAVDITTKDSGGSRTLLAGGGIQSVSASASGAFLDTAAEIAVRTALAAQAQTSDGSAAQASAFTNFQVIVPDLGTFSGAFMIAGLDYNGEHNGEVTYTLTLESSGFITFAAA